MAKTRGTGLLMVWTDIDPEFEAEFNRWYDEEHIPRLLEIPGFLSAGRYVAIKGAPKYLAMYELEDHNVLRSAPPTSTRSNTRLRHKGRRPGAAVSGVIFCAMRTGRFSRCTRIRLSRLRRWRRFSKWVGSTFPPRWRKNSTPGTTPPISRDIWRCRVVSARAGLSRSRGSRNT